MSIAINILLVFEVLICLLLILIVLMQRPKNEGLGVAFGGGVTENLLGHQTTNVLQTMTRNLGIAFFAISAALGWLTVRESVAKSSVDKVLRSSAVPAAPAPGAEVELPSTATEPVQIPNTTGSPPPPPGSEGDTKKPATPPSASEGGNTPPPPAPAPAPASSEDKPKPAPAPVPEPPKPAEPPKQ